MNGLAGCYVSTIGKPHEYFDLTTVTTTVKVTNLFNQTVQQHIFGDLLRRTVLGEVKFRF